MAAPREGESRLSQALLSTPSTPDATQSGCLRQRYPGVPGEHGTCGYRAGSHTEAVQKADGAPGRGGWLSSKAASSDPVLRSMPGWGEAVPGTGGRQCQALVGKTPLAPGGFMGPTGGCRAGPGM